MQYFGGKARLAKYIVPILEKLRDKDQAFVEPFVGGANIISKMSGLRYGYDLHPKLIALYNSIQNGWIPPDVVSEDLYKQGLAGELEDNLTAFIGFGCCYSGKYYHGFARNNRGDNYAKAAKNSLLRKFATLKGVVFSVADYKNLCYSNCLIYCDPPYKSTEGYSVGKFDSIEFWRTVREWSKYNTVVVSEYVAPDDFIPIWTKPVKLEIRNKNNKRYDRVEKLFIHKSLLYKCLSKLMSGMSNIKRTPIKELPFEVDLSIPVDTKDEKFKEFMLKQKCFGKEWDISTNECSQCSAKDICGILFKDLIDKKAKDLEKKIGSKFLDEEDLRGVTDEQILSGIESGKTTTKQLISHLKKTANLDDDKAIILYLKRWITGKKLVRTKNSIVWIN